MQWWGLHLQMTNNTNDWLVENKCWNWCNTLRRKRSVNWSLKSHYTLTVAKLPPKLHAKSLIISRTLFASQLLVERERERCRVRKITSLWRREIVVAAVVFLLGTADQFWPQYQQIPNCCKPAALTRWQTDRHDLWLSVMRHFAVTFLSRQLHVVSRVIPREYYSSVN